MNKRSISAELSLTASQSIAENQYWLEKLSGELIKTGFPYDRQPTAESMSDNVREKPFTLPGEILNRLMKIVSGSDIRLHMLFVTAVLTLLNKYNYGSRDIIIGVPVYKQEREGKFINTVLTLRNELAPSMSFKELLLDVRREITEAVEHQNYPIETLLYNLDVPSLFDAAVLLENIHDRAYLEPVAVNMIFSFKREGEEVSGKVEYNAALYEAATVEHILTHFKRLLREVLFNVDIPLAEISILSPEEKQQLLYEFNDSSLDYEAHKTIDRLFADQVEKTPDNTALVGVGAKHPGQVQNGNASPLRQTTICLTYRELNRAANQLAHLLRKKGVTPGTIVGLLLERIIAMAVAIIAVIKAGGAYLPVTPDTPTNRIVALLEDAGAPLLLTHGSAISLHSYTALQGLRVTRSLPIRTSPRRPIPDMDTLPIPDRSLIDYEKYTRNIGLAMVKHSITMQGTRGCPYNCIYCARLWPRKQVKRSAENLYAEVKRYYDMGVRRFSLIDDIFNLDTANSKRFFRLIIDNKLNIRLLFPAGLRGDIMTGDYIDLMVEAGTINISVALETASPRLQKLIRKNLDIEKLHKNLQYICTAHQHVILDLFTMHGLPYETEEEAKMTLDFIKSLKWLHFPLINITRIYPDTDMEKMALESGISREAILRAENLAWHEAADTLHFHKNFTTQYQADFLENYFLQKERLLHVLPFQMKVLTEDELVSKYNSYLPIDRSIENIDDLLEFIGIDKKDLASTACVPEKRFAIPGLNHRIRHSFPQKKPQPDALRVLLLDLSQSYTEGRKLLDVLFEAPLGLMYLMTYLQREFGSKIKGLIKKSGVDFDSNEQLKELMDNFKPQVIGIRTLTFYKDFFHRTAARIRQWGYDVPIIAGGPYATNGCTALLQDRNIDLVVLAEGEVTFSEVIKSIIENRGQLPAEEILRKIPGIAFTPGRDDPVKRSHLARDILSINELHDSLANEPAENPGQVSRPLHPVYTIFTSGSTGIPKGVIIRHQNLHNLVIGLNERIYKKYEQALKTAMISPYIFDASVKMIFAALLLGHTLHIVPEDTRVDGNLLLDYFENFKIEVCDGTPTHLKLLMESGIGNRKNLRLKQLLIGGEPLNKAALAQFFSEFPGNPPIVTNVYGPTECSVDAAALDIPAADLPGIEKITIGKPMPNHRIYILDTGANNRLQPVGVPGELCIAGHGVSAGYLNRPELTAEKFINLASGGQKPFCKKVSGLPKTFVNNKSFSGGPGGPTCVGERLAAPRQFPEKKSMVLLMAPRAAGLVAEGIKLYKSGDLARWLPDGNIEFLGRLDQQVKIRGYRLEPGEIENRLLKHKRIKEAIVVAKKENGEADYLCAYIVVKNTSSAVPSDFASGGQGAFLKNRPLDPHKTFDEGQETRAPGARHAVPGLIDTGELRRFLSRSLPDYMIPPYFVQLQELPLTPNGKVDRRALPRPEIDGREGSYVPPQNDCQEKITDIWCDILRIDKEKIGIDTNFFEVGGHSLKATILIARIHQAFDVKICLAKIFENPTIRGISAEISRSGKTGFADLAEIEKREYYPLSFSQRRIWRINRSESHSSAYTMTGSIALHHEVVSENIRGILDRLMKRHENFRTGFKIVDEEPVQFIVPEIAMAFVTIDLSAFEEQEKQEERDRIFKELSGTTFNLSRPPLFRSSLLKFAKDRSEFIFCMHFIVSDGWSMEILTDEFRRLYRAAETGEAQETRLTAIRFQYKDFALWQNKQLTLPAGKRAYRFWKNRLEKGVPTVRIPGDFQNHGDVRPGSAWSCVVDSELKEKIKQLAGSTDTTLFTVMFSACLLLISRFSGRQEVLCSIINSGRDHYALHRITGFFVNSILFHNHIDDRERFRDFVKRVNADTMEVFNHQNFPLQPVFGQLQLEYPTVPISINMLNMQDRTAREELEIYEPFHRDDYPDVKHDIEVYLFEYKNCIEMRWTYNRNIYKPGTLKYIIDEYINILGYFTSHANESCAAYRQSSAPVEVPGRVDTGDKETKAGQVNTSGTDMFDAATLKELEDFAGEEEEEKYRDIEAVEKKSYYGLSSAQKRLFILEQQGSMGTVHNMPGAVKIEGPLNEDTLNRTFRALIERHESLRTAFTWVKGEPVQRVFTAREINFKIENPNVGARRAVPGEFPSPGGVAAGRGGLETITDPRNLVNRFIRPFDLAKAPLLRAGLIRLGQDEHILSFDMHHIISDGASYDLLVREFIRLYTGDKLPGLRIQYKDFCQWEKSSFGSPIFKRQEKFWLETLAGELPKLQMPLDFSRPERKTFAGKKIPFTIPVEMTSKLALLAQEKNMTLNILVLSAYFLLLYKYSGQEDIIAASPVGGRNHVGLTGLIGMFGSALPIRTRIDPGETLGDFLDHTRQVLVACYENSDCPLEKIVEIVNPPVDISRNPLFDTMLTFHNEIEQSLRAEIAGLEFSNYSLSRRASQFDFKIDIFMGDKGDLTGLLEFNTALFKEETMRRFSDHFIVLIDKIVTGAEKRIAGIEIFSEKEKCELPEKRKLNAPALKKVVRLVLAATFTAEPVENHILWWGRQFGLHIDLAFAPYNQVFPQLLDDDSLLSTNKGINVLFIRFADWIRGLDLPDEDTCDKLEEDFENLIKIFKEKKKTSPYLIGLFPAAPAVTVSDKVRYYLEGMNRRWQKIVEKIENAYIIDFTSLAELYAVEDIFDPLTDKEGHIPFSGEFYAAVGAAAVRKIHALAQTPFKVIALDCDNTLWKGICGEDGATGVRGDGPYRELQQFMINRYNEGFLLTLCSKNNEADVWEVFEKNPGMVLKKEHFVNWRINWQPKSVNLRALAEKLNLGIDSFIFLDDSPVECAEMRANCPEVLTLQLPRHPESIPLFLRHVWAFDKIKVTAEDRSRTRMYQAEKERKAAEKGSLTLKDFLAGLQLKISMNFMAADQVERVSQLTQRTNQFNLSTIRRRQDEIVEMAAAPGIEVWVVEVSDRFGDYGLVGVVITKVEKDFLFIDTFLLSCRVLGREVETAILTGLRRYCEELRLNRLEAHYYPGKKNKPFLNFLQQKWQLRQKHSEEYTTFVYPFAETSESSEFAEFYYLEKFATGQPRHLPAGEKSVPGEAFIPAAANTEKEEAAALTRVNWDIDIDGCSSMLPKKYLLPLKHHSAAQLMALPIHDLEQEVVRRTRYEQPQSQRGKKLVEIWEDILKVEKVGINESFFELGGNSLKAAALLSAVYKTFARELSLKDIFDNRTIKDLSRLVDTEEKETYSSIELANKKEYYLLSSAQKRLFILDRLIKNNLSYNTTGIWKLEEEINKNGVEEIFKKLIARHESLRTSFDVIDEVPVQKIHNQEEIDFRIEYYETGRRQEAAGSGEDEIIQRFIRPFDLSRPPLIRTGLIHAAGPEKSPKEENKAGTYILMVSMHHIISDGLSLELLGLDFMRLYRGEELSELKIQYKDYAEWHNSEKEAAKRKKQEEYWLHTFAGEIPVPDLPTDYPRPAVQSFMGDSLSFNIGNEQTIALKTIVKEEEATLFILLLTLHNILLAKLSGREDIVIGCPTAGRWHPELEPVVGIFINMLALRNFPAAAKSFRGFLRQVKERTLDAFANQDCQFEDLVDILKVRRDLSRNPLFDVMFQLQNFEMEAQSRYTRGEKIEKDRIPLAPYDYTKKTSQFDLAFTVIEKKEDLLFSIEYCTDLFKEETIERFALYLQRLISAVIENHDISIAEIEITSEREREQVLYEFNDTAVKFPTGKTVHRLFEEQVRRTPDNIALLGNSDGYNVQVTYRDLNRKSNRLARTLEKEGVQSERIVGLMVGRSVEILVGLFGILKAGAAYLPIGPEYPVERVKYMLRHSGADIVLTGDNGTLPDHPGLYLDVDDPENFSIEDEDLPPVSDSGNLAYVIYTSGTTGLPKGVMIENRSLVNFIKGITDVIPFKENDTILSLTTISFDIFGLETILSLTQGSKVIIGSAGEQLNAAAAGFLLVKEMVTIFQVTPSRLQLFMSDEEAAGSLRFLNHLIVGGEAFPPPLLEKAGKFVTGKIYNIYGPTETTIWSTIKEVSRGEALNIGRPLANTQVYILDKQGALQPVGVTGEIYISGEGVARGYYKDEALTNEKFIKNPFSPGSRLYRTGDSGRWLPNGSIDCLGRIDHQVKIRGFRIELEEIETQLQKHEKIKEVVVVVREDAAAEKYLCAYILGTKAAFTEKNEPGVEGTGAAHPEDGSPDAGELREFLSQSLPAYMIPAYFVELEKIPLSPNGKIDRKALPEPEVKAAGKYTAPGNEIEKELVAVWVDVLPGTKSSTVGIDDDFFELGGQSLKATIMMARMHKRFGVEMSLIEIFKSPTIRGLAKCIAGSREKVYIAVEPVEKKEYYTLSSAQRRLYILQQMEPGGLGYNMSLVMELQEEPDREKYKQAFIKLIQQHESLRTSFHMIGDETVQRVHEPRDTRFAIEYYRIGNREQGFGIREEKTGNREKQENRPVGDAYMRPNPDVGARRAVPGEFPSPGGVAAGRGGLETITHHGDLIQQIQEDFIRPFDLAQAPLLRVGLLRGGSGEEAPHILLIDMHHIISDRVSLEVLRQDFISLFGGKESKPLKLHYKDFACWQDRQIREGAFAATGAVGDRSRKIFAHSGTESFWLQEFAGELPYLNLPLDFPRANVRSYEGSTVEFSIDRGKNRALKKLARREGASLQIIMLAILNVLLAKVCGQEDIIIGTPAAGRRHADLTDVIGLFVNTLALRNFPTAEKSFREFLKEVGERSLKAYDNQDYPFDSLVEKVWLNRDMARNPLFDVMFEIFTIPEGLPGMKVENTGGEAGQEFQANRRERRITKMDIDWYGVAGREKLFFTVYYSTLLFKEETIERLAGHYLEITEQILANNEIKLKDIILSHSFVPVQSRVSQEDEGDFGF